MDVTGLRCGVAVCPSPRTKFGTPRAAPNTAAQLRAVGLLLAASALDTALSASPAARVCRVPRGLRATQSNRDITRSYPTLSLSYDPQDMRASRVPP